jgi:hypothetical protein
VSRPKPKARAAHLHRDDVKPRNSRLSIRKTEEYGFIRLPEPPYSPDLARRGFFLFSYFKSQLEGKTLFDEDGVKEEVRRILTEIPINRLQSGRDKRVRRPELCIELVGECLS